MERPTCKTCLYFVCAACDKSPILFEPCCEEDGKPVHDATLCKRHPLLFIQLDSNSTVFGQPEVHQNDWCGEHSDFPAYIASLKAESNKPHDDMITLVGSNLGVRARKSIMKALAKKQGVSLVKSYGQTFPRAVFALLTLEDLRSTKQCGSATMPSIIEFAKENGINLRDRDV